MSTTEDIFNKARVSNIMAAVTIATMLYGFITGVPDTIVEGSMMGVIAGFTPNIDTYTNQELTDRRIN